MNWIILSLLAPLAWGIANVLDKYLFAKWLKDPLVGVVIFGLIGGVASLLIYLIKGFSHVSSPGMLLGLITGLIYFFANLLYFRAVKAGEISRVISLLYLDPLFTAVLSAMFIGEIFSLTKYVGIVLLVIGAVIISYKSSSKPVPKKVIWFCLASAFLFSICNILTKYLLFHNDYWTVFSYVRLGTLLAVIPVCFTKYKQVWELATKHNAGFSVSVLSNSLSLVGVVFFTIASSVGYVTLVTSLNAVQPFFVFALAFIVHKFSPKIMDEEFGKSVVLQKLLAIVLIFIGAILVA